MDPTCHKSTNMSLDQWTFAWSDRHFHLWFTCFENDPHPFSSHSNDFSLMSTYPQREARFPWETRRRKCVTFTSPLFRESPSKLGHVGKYTLSHHNTQTDDAFNNDASTRPQIQSISNVIWWELVASIYNTSDYNLGASSGLFGAPRAAPCGTATTNNKNYLKSKCWSIQ